MTKAERTNDSIFRVPQRVKNAMSILVATATAAGCAPKPTQPPVGSTEMPGTPIPTHIDTITPILTPSGPEATPTNTPTPTETSTPTETPLPLLSENPTADKLFAAKEGQIPEKFNFGGHVWTEGVNAKGEKVWTREDGKIDLEWASLYGGGVYNAYMFVTRSEPAVGKRTLEIYADPRSLIFNIITGSPSAVDTFVGQTVANVMTGDDAQKVLRQPGSTLIIIIGGIEYWPLGTSAGFLTRQNISYPGPNGETLWQKIWAMRQGDQGGTIGPFVDSADSSVQCALFEGLQYWSELNDILLQKTYPANRLSAGAVVSSINGGSSYDPERSTTPTGTGVHLDWSLAAPLLSAEEYASK